MSKPTIPLGTPIDQDDTGALTVGAYLADLLCALIRETEGFSGKRPLGNSGWMGYFDGAAVKAGLVAGTLDEDGYVEDVDDAAVESLLIATVRKAFAG